MRIIEGLEVEQLLVHDGRVSGVETSQGGFGAPLVISAQNIWAGDIDRWTGITPGGRRAPPRLGAAWAARLRLFDAGVLASGFRGMLYCRSYGGRQMLVSEGTAGERLDAPDNTPAEIPIDAIADIGAQVAERFPSFETAGVASSWTGVYDVTPDWNPVLGRLPDLPSLIVAYGFSGHGFKLSPAGGRVLSGRCGSGAVS